MLTFTAQQAMQVRLLATNRQVIPAGTADFEPTAFDHVVRTFSDFPTPVANIIDLTTGSWALAGAVDLGSALVRVAAGQTVYLQGMGWDKVLSRVSTPTVLVAGTLLACDVAISGNRALQLSGAAADVYLINCNLSGTTTAVLVSLGDHLTVIGGKLSGNSGLTISGNMTSTILKGVLGVATASFVSYTAGAVSRFIMRACDVTGTTGVSWAAGSIPFQGLSVVGNQIDWSVAAYAGHTPASARVNYKSNTDSSVGALITETAIVP